MAVVSIFVVVVVVVVVAITDVAELVITVDELVVAITFDVKTAAVAAAGAVGETMTTFCSLNISKNKKKQNFYFRND